MRSDLASVKDTIRTYTATFIKDFVGKDANGKSSHSVLVHDLRNSNNKMIGDGHLWVTFPYPIRDLVKGDRITFEAVSYAYNRSDKSRDWSLTVRSYKKMEVV
jgi:hypothetical protein